MRSRKGGRKVVSFLPSASKAGRYVLLLDDGRKVVSYQLGLEEASLFPLYAGKVLSAKEENALAQALASSKARSKALALLKRRPYAEKELEERLLRDGKLKYPEVKEATRFLSEEGLVDDRSYAVDKAEEAAYTLKGKRKVLHELREAGVEESIVSSLSFDQEREKAAEDLKRILPCCLQICKLLPSHLQQLANILLLFLHYLIILCFCHFLISYYAFRCFSF